MTNKEIEKMRDAHDAAIIYLMKDKHIKGAVKGSVPDLLVLLGYMMVDLHEDSGIALKDLGEWLNEVVAKEVALREKKK
jgi:hypothetical protein